MALAIKEARTEPMWTTFYGGTDGYCGKTMANGMPYDCSAFTAASPSLPLGSEVLACFDGCVQVVITDRCACGLDLSMAAADAIGLPGSGIAEVTRL